MRTELNKLELIENYLAGKLAKEDESTFENYIQSGEISAKDIEAVRQIKKAAKFMYLQEQAGKASIRYKNRLYIKRFLYTFGLVVLVSSLVLGIYHFLHKEEVFQVVNRTATPSVSDIKSIPLVIDSVVQDSQLVSRVRRKKYAKPIAPIIYVNAALVNGVSVLPPKDSIGPAIAPVLANNLHEIFEKVYRRDLLPEELFAIDIRRDTVVMSKKGTQLYIPAFAFRLGGADSLRYIVTLSLKEILSRRDMVLYNLTTVTDRYGYLESGGMLHIETVKPREGLRLYKPIGVKVPTQNKEWDMNIYEGMNDSNFIKWKNPQPLATTSLVAEGNFTPDNRLGDQVISEGCWGRFLNIFRRKGNSISKADQLALQKRNDSLTQAMAAKASANEFANNYIFNLNHLGWANIDRVLDDKRTQLVTLETDVTNKKEFGAVYTSMIFRCKNIHIPGYQMANGTYGYTHGDYEKPRLPVGEEAYIIATAIRDDKIYFSLQQFTVNKEQKIILTLKETTREELMRILEGAL
jgi:hypothetical protein